MARATSEDGTGLYYTTAGDGPPLLLCTASFSTHEHWAYNFDDLAAFTRPVGWDYRGHGLSGAPADEKDFSLAHFLADLGAVHDAVGGEPAVICGLSFGGCLAICYALARPERVRGLVLINSGPGFKKPEAQAGWEKMLGKAATRMAEVGLATYLEGGRASAELLGLDPTTPAARRAREGILRSDPAALARFARKVAGPIPPLIDRLGEISVPTHIVIGAEDANFQRAGEVMEAKIPGATRVVVPGAGHVLNLDAPDHFAAEIRSLLGRL